MSIEEGSLVSGGNMSGNITGTSFALRTVRFEAYGASVVASWTGSPVGTLNLEVSTDDSTWGALESVATGGAAGSKAWNLTDVQYAHLRVSYAATSGTGTLTARARAKSIWNI